MAWVFGCLCLLPVHYSEKKTKRNSATRFRTCLCPSHSYYGGYNHDDNNHKKKKKKKKKNRNLLEK